MPSLSIALQLYTVRDHLERNLNGTLRSVREIGYEYVELFDVYGSDSLKYKKRLEDAGLAAMSMHIPFDVVRKNPETAIESAKALNLRYVVVPWIGPETATTANEWVACARHLDAAGAKLAEENIRLCYHHHGHEFQKLDGRYVFDIIMDTSAPEHLAAELDTYWMAYGGADPATEITKHRNRCPLLHIKDMGHGEEKAFTELGRGQLDWNGVFEAAKTAGVQWYIVEQDESALDSLESTKMSLMYLTAGQLMDSQ